MTLTTRVRIIEPTPVKPVFDAARALLGAEDATWHHETVGTYGARNDNYRNGAYRNGLGFDALLWVSYGSDAPLADYPCEDYDCTPERHRCPPEASIEVVFDTVYSWRTDAGAGCDDLHAYLVGQLGRWLDEWRLTWFWQDEYRGDWHRGTEGLAEFGRAELLEGEILGRGC